MTVVNDKNLVTLPYQESLRFRTYDVLPAKHMSYVMSGSTVPLAAIDPSGITMAALVVNSLVSGVHSYNQSRWRDERSTRTNVLMASQANELTILSAVGNAAFITYMATKRAPELHAKHHGEATAAMTVGEITTGAALLVGLYALYRRPTIRRAKAALAQAPSIDLN